VEGLEYRLSSIRDRGIGCDATGAFIEGIPLLKRSDNESRGAWVPRPTAELNHVLSALYGVPIDISTKMGGLSTIAQALNQDNIVIAQIATLHLRLPLPPTIGKAAQSPGQIALLTFAGLLKADWDPAKHPRAGVPPNPGWFTDTDRQPDERALPNSPSAPLFPSQISVAVSTTRP